MKLQELDVVRLARPLEDPALEAGARGTIVMDYFSTPPAYEVEFFDSEGSTIALATVAGSDLELVERPSLR